MSASFPGSSQWEPYAPSAQASSLGWRRPATLPPRASPPSHRSVIPLWNPAHHSLPPPRSSCITPTPPSQPLSQLTPQSSSQPILHPSADLRAQERESCLLARYDQVRAAVRAVDARVPELLARFRGAEEAAEKRADGLNADIARLQGLVNTLREEVTAQQKSIEGNPERLETQLEEMILLAGRGLERGDARGRQVLRRVAEIVGRLDDVERYLQGLPRAVEGAVTEGVARALEQINLRERIERVAVASLSDGKDTVPSLFCGERRFRCQTSSPHRLLSPQGIDAEVPLRLRIRGTCSDEEVSHNSYVTNLFQEQECVPLQQEYSAADERQTPWFRPASAGSLSSTLRLAANDVLKQRSRQVSRDGEGKRKFSQSASGSSVCPAPVEDKLYAARLEDVKGSNGISKKRQRRSTRVTRSRRTKATSNNMDS